MPSGDPEKLLCPYKILTGLEYNLFCQSLFPVILALSVDDLHESVGAIL